MRKTSRMMERLLPYIMLGVATVFAFKFLAFFINTLVAGIGIGLVLFGLACLKELIWDKKASPDTIEQNAS